MGRAWCSKLASLLLSSLEEIAVRADSRLLLSSEASFGMVVVAAADGSRDFALSPDRAPLEYTGAVFGDVRLLTVVATDDELFT